MTKPLFAIATMFLLNASAFAAEIDLQKSSVSWKGSKITGAHHIGQISPKSSSLQLVEGVVSSGEVVFAMSSLTVGDLKGEWKAKFLRHMQSPDFFDVVKFPTATLSLNTVTDGQAKGTLTIKGITQPITFPVQHDDGKYVGKATFDRTKFGITFGSGNFFEDLGDKLIHDEVDVEFTLVVKGK